MSNFMALKDNFFFDMLYFKSPEIFKVAEFITQKSKLFIGVFFTFSSLWEFFKDADYEGVLKRTVLCFLIIALYRPFLLKGLEISFTVSEKILKSVSQDNHLVLGLKKAKKLAEKKIRKRRSSKKRSGVAGWWDRQVVMAKVLWSDWISTIIWLLVFIAFMMLKTIYTITFSLLFVFLPLQALFSIFSLTSNALKGSLKTYITLLTTPMVITVILVVLGSNVAFITDFSNYTLAENLRGLVQLLLSAVLLLFAPSFAASLFDGSGNASIGGKVSQVGSSAIMTMGLGSIMSWAMKAPSKLMSSTSKGIKGAILPKSLDWVLPNRSFFKGTKNLQRQRQKVTSTQQNGAARSSRDHKNQESYQGQGTSTNQTGGSGNSSQRRSATKLSTNTNKSSVSRVAQKIPFSPQRREAKELDRRAKRYIELSHSGNINPENFSKKEMARAVEIARKDPKKSFIKKSFYYHAIAQAMKADPTQVTEKKPRKKRRPKSIKRRRNVLSKRK